MVEKIVVSGFRESQTAVPNSASSLGVLTYAWHIAVYWSVRELDISTQGWAAVWEENDPGEL